MDALAAGGLPRRPGPTVRVRVEEVQGATRHPREDRLATEEPLEIRVTWPGRPAERLSVTMRTPGHDFELATGFLLGEGVLRPADLAGVAYCTDADLAPEEQFNVVTVSLAAAPPHVPAPRYAGPTAGSAACGVCGKDSVADALAVHACAPGRWADLRVGADVLGALPERLRAAQRVFDRTGGLHAAGLFTAAGEPLVVREDIGRHNAVDKVVGARVLADEETADPVLCVSGRIGFELAQKAAAAGVGIIAGVGAPSSLAVSLARDAALTVVGFLRPDRCVVYTAPERVLTPS
ncbi:MAG: formate dehydrogenase accessory sulfurtransferase FdhD [Nocardioides sp.]|nr:formate dehydrogenase accessory sulfurtransferase FdhD [Nocardioides sp.]